MLQVYSVLIEWAVVVTAATTEFKKILNLITPFSKVMSKKKATQHTFLIMSLANDNPLLRKTIPEKHHKDSSIHPHRTQKWSADVSDQESLFNIGHVNLKELHYCRRPNIYEPHRCTTNIIYLTVNIQHKVILHDLHHWI